ncbi:MAG: DUF1570 domain-containing protein [Pirellulales bacterium]|nr:DUF1570 domain-containing protein [Pirellulales bacterium]
MPLTDTVVRDQLIVTSNFQLPKQHRLIEELAAQRGELTAKLALPTSDEPIHVYLFGTPEHFNRYVHEHYPGFPTRRAFFVETDTQLAVYAHWGDRLAEDLRHEVAHGYLHAVVPNLPLWLDEGIAEYFEVPRGHRGLNRPHVEAITARLAGGAWHPDLRRLESFSSASDMEQLDYAESWAWVHLLVETEPERLELLREYLTILRRDAMAPPMSNLIRRALPNAEDAFAEHIRQCTSQQPPAE